MEDQTPSITNGAVGDPRSKTSTILETGAAATQVPHSDLARPARTNLPPIGF